MANSAEGETDGEEKDLDEMEDAADESRSPDLDNNGHNAISGTYTADNGTTITDEKFRGLRKEKPAAKSPISGGTMGASNAVGESQNNRVLRGLSKNALPNQRLKGSQIRKSGPAINSNPIVLRGLSKNALPNQRVKGSQIRKSGPAINSNPIATSEKFRGMRGLGKNSLMPGNSSQPLNLASSNDSTRICASENFQGLRGLGKNSPSEQNASLSVNRTHTAEPASEPVTSQGGSMDPFPSNLAFSDPEIELSQQGPESQPISISDRAGQETRISETTEASTGTNSFPEGQDASATETPNDSSADQEDGASLNSGIPIAAEVAEDDTAVEHRVRRQIIDGAVHALEVTKTMPRWKRNLLLGSALFVLVAVIVTALSASLTRESETIVVTESPTISPAPSVSPSASPTLERVTILLRTLADALGNSNAPATDGSPQNQALKWLAEEDGLFLPVDESSLDILIQRFALATFFFATGGEQWIDSLNFLTAVSVCDWNSGNAGVYCEDEDDIVTRITIPRNNLQGDIPTEVSLLSRLEGIELVANKLTSIPSELGLLPLIGILIDQNRLSGSFPSTIWGLTSLARLNLSQNPNLSGTMGTEIGRLSNLKDLKLFSLALQGSIPTEIGNASGLQQLVLSSGKLAGTIPLEIGRLEGLYFLNLQDNAGITGTIPLELGNLSRLVTLYLNSTDLSGTIPPVLGNLATLKQLDLSANRLTGTIPTELYGLLKLEQLTLFGNILTGRLESTVGALTALTELSVFENQMTGKLPTELGLLTNLLRFYPFTQRFSGTIPSEIGNMKSLEEAVLFVNLFTGQIPCEIGSIETLRRLEMSYNELTGTVPEALARLPNLKILDLNNNDLTGDLDVLFCLNRSNDELINLQADCAGDNPQVQCTCCSECSEG